MTEWDSTINTRFFGFSEKPKERTKKTEYLSGRVTAYNTNTRSVMTFSCSIRLKKNELKRFWAWFNDELGGTAGVFTCAALGGKYYRFSEIPEPQDTGQKYRTLDLSIEEVY